MSRNPVNSAAPFQPEVLDGQIGGAGAGTVNKFRGDIMVPLAISDMPGLNEISIKLMAACASNIFRIAKRDNAQAPTSILGLGWSLPRERIVVMGKRSLGIDSGAYAIENNGTLFTLVLLASHLNTYVFATDSLPLWQFTYDPAVESWTVRLPDGSRRLYGGHTTEGNCEFGLAWDGWIGASTTPNGTSYVVAWNLARVENAWGIGLSYVYDVDTLPVGTNLSYTRATYLAKITDDLGQGVELSYLDKERFEWQCPHLYKGEPNTAYQDRYETKFLNRVTEYSNWQSKTAIRVVSFGYDFCNLVDPAEEKYTKRLLTSVESSLNGIAKEPATKFSYNADAGAPAPGALTATLTPAGSKTDYSYKTISLNATSNPLFNKSLTIEPPAGSKGARPYLLPSEGFLAVTWLNSTSGSAAIQIYSFGGAWSKPWSPSSPIAGAFDAEGIVYAQTSTMIALFLPPLSGAAGNNAYLLLLRRDPYQQNVWHMEKRTISLTTKVASVRASLVGGEDFFALSIVGQGRFQIFSYEPTTQSWTDTLFTLAVPNVVVGTDGIRTLVGAISNAGSLSISLYSRGIDRSWSLTGTPISRNGVQWNENYVGSLLNCGPNFGAVTYVDAAGGQLLLLKWNAEGKFAGTYGARAETAHTYVSETIVINGPRVFRYDAGAWKPFTFTDDPNASYVIGDDFAVRTLSVGSPAVAMIRYAPTTGSWVSEQLAEANAILYRPTLAGNIMTCGTKVYRRQADESWSPIADLSTSGDPQSLVNRGSYIIYTEALAAGAKRVVVLLLGDARKVDIAYFDGQIFGGDVAWFTAPACASQRAFATFPKGSNPVAPASLVLHRILNNSLSDEQTDDVIGSLAVDDGFQTTRSDYDYDTASALFDPTGQVVQYPEVQERLIDSAGFATGGRIETHYYNGLPIADDPELDAFHSLVAGREYDTSVYTVEDLQLFQRKIEWQGLRLEHGVASRVELLLPAAMPVIRATKTVDGLLQIFTADAEAGASFDNGVIPLSVFDAFEAAGLPLSPDATVASVVQGISWLINSDNRRFAARFTPSGLIELTSELGRRKEQSYDPQTGSMVTQSTVNREADGTLSTITAQLIYAWTLPEYTDMKATRQLGAVAETRLTNVTHTTTIASSVTTWTNEWEHADAPYDNLAEYAWNGPGAQAPAFDFSNPDANVEWVRNNEVVGRAPTGVALQWRNALGVSSCQILDSQNVRTIASFQNAGTGANRQGAAGQPECTYTGFESYEATGPWSTTNGSLLSDLISTDKAHSGRASLKLSSAAQAPGIEARFALSEGVTRVAFNLWLWNEADSTPGGGIAISFSDSTQRYDIAFEPAFGNWIKLQRALTVPVDATEMLIEFGNAGASTNEFVDDIAIFPLPGSASATVYDVDTLLVTSQIDDNGATTRSYYDEGYHALASTNADGKVIALASGGFSRLPDGNDSFDASAPNCSLNIQSSAGGSFESFTDDKWRTNWTPSPVDGWQVQSATVLSNQLTVVEAGAVRLTTTGTFADEGVACRMRIVPPTEGWRDAIAVRISDVGAIEWSPANGAWRILDGQGAEKTRVAQLELAAAEWIVARYGETLALFIDGKPTIGAALDGKAGHLSVETTEAVGLSVSGLTLLPKPQIALDFLDALSMPFQSQIFDEEGMIASATLKDRLGRSVITTKAARYENGTPGIRKELVSSIDWTTGVMSGDVADYYSGKDDRSNDEGYPYKRVLLEMAPIDRQRAIGSPGKVHAIYPEGNHFTETPTITNVTGDMAQGVSSGLFCGTEIRDADGARTRTFTDDRFSELRRRFLAPPHYGPFERLSARTFDARGQLTTMLPPMVFATGNESYAQSRKTDPLGNILQTYSSDCGETKVIYDKLGQPRFTLIADGVAKGAGGADRIVYLRYDPLGRVFESGTIDHAWDPVALTPLANTDWPTDGKWEANLVWDCLEAGDVADPVNGIGRTVAFRRSQLEANNSWIQLNSYDAAGNLVEIRQTDVKGVRAQHYAVDAVGQITSLSFDPAGQPTIVFYQRDLQGRVTKIGSETDPLRWACYRYTADGLPQEEILNPSGTAPFTRQFQYNSLDLLIETRSEVFNEALSYWETPGADGTTYYQGQITKAVFSPGPAARSAGLVVDDWENAYDAAGNISAVVNADGMLRSIGGVDATMRYDANDNMLSVVDRGIDRSFTIKDGTNQLVGMTTPDHEEIYTYSAGGNLVSASGRALDSLSYNLVNGLVSSGAMADGSSFEVGYGEGDERIELTQLSAAGEPASKTSYLRDESGNILAEAEENGGSMTYIPGPFGFVAVVDENLSTGFVIRDRQNSTRLVLAEDGTILAGYAYDPFGGMSQTPVGPWAENVRFLFIGQEYDARTGLYNLNARLYDPITRRFLSPDPLRSTSSPYPYVSNIPFQASDPSGLLAFLAALAIGAIVGAIIGGGVSAITYAAQNDWQIKDWGEFWKEVGIGAAVGFVTGALAVATGGGATAGLVSAAARVGGRVATFAATTAGRVAIGTASGAISGAVSGASGQVMENAIRGEKGADLFKNVGWATLTGAGTGAILGGLTSAFYFPGPRGPRINAAADGDTYANRVLNAGNLLKNPRAPVAPVPVQTNSYITWRDLMKLAPRGTPNTFNSNNMFGLKFRSSNVPRTGGAGPETHFEVRFHSQQPGLGAGMRGGRYWTAKIGYGTSNTQLNAGRNLLHEGGAFYNVNSNNLPETHLRFRFWSWT
ncbi:RHS repeat-associated core domain-containing protein [Rhizobium sp. CNPSo 4039]|uniref:RHS repeat domain-containing protein n=1 Tax=Rhizobium sp. CNPSo 4039 TaxID=3021409 RepID=UPI00254A097E|nr:RHS repeat-associated core domain-containing protein [Rhizobium sp. CNPSo 4039]MDK4715899.1 RHS repeat-associated core domain-containing protein [Rhizobium sp. CNPSo 4039]